MCWGGARFIFIGLGVLCAASIDPPRPTRGRYSLTFSNCQATRVLTGARIRVRGVQAGTTLALATDVAAVQTVVPAPVPNTLGEQRPLVMLVNFQDNPTQPYTLAEAQSVIFGTTSNFFL